MMLLALASPVLGIGLVMVLEVFETWTLGGPNRPAQPPRQLQSPQKCKTPGGIPYPATGRPDQMSVAGS